MSVLKYSEKRNRAYVCKFDHDEARVRYAAGETQSELARRYGVSRARIRQIVLPEVGERARRESLARMRSGVCERCGKGCSLYSLHCAPCAAVARTTSVRDDELLCFSCREWKADALFPRNRNESYRRGRHSGCTACGTKAKREWRRRTGKP